MTTKKTGAKSSFARIGVSLALAVTAVGGLATPGHAAAATVPVITPSSSFGSVAGGATLVLTLASTAAAKFSSGNVGIQFQLTTAANVAKATCTTAPDVASTTVTYYPGANPNSGAPSYGATAIRFLSSTKVSIYTPTNLTGTGGYYLICAYSAAQASGVIPATGALLGRGTYVVATAPTVTTVNTIASPNPVSGPSLGGQTLTVVGTNFPTTITAGSPLTATLGGLPLLNITPVNATSFTAVTPAKAASTGNLLTVTTLGGSVTWGGSYSYINGITVSPTTVVGGQSVDVDIQGVGFNGLTFNATATAGTTQTAAGDSTGTNDANAHVYLVKGLYNQAVYDATHDKTNGQVAECVNPVVISDAELICTVDASKSITVAAHVYTYSTPALADGAYTVTIVNKGNATAPTFQTVVSSGATFTVAAF